MNDWLDLAIENWVRWGRTKRWRIHCMSIESAYRSPQRSHWPDDAPPYEIRLVGLVAALAVERAWRDLPYVPKQVLKNWYVVKQPAGQICRELKKQGYPVEMRWWDLELKRARLLLSEGLQDDKDDGIIQVSPEGVAMAQMGGPRSLQRAA